jgi:adenosylhomocysteine nucleosidase
MEEGSTGESRTGTNTERGVAPAPVPADVGIVAALPIEVDDLISGLRRVWKYRSIAVPVIEGEYGGKIVAVAIGGVGRRAARRAADVLISGHRPRWIISAGFAGALNPAYARNDLVLPREVIEIEGGVYPIETPPVVGANLPHAVGRLLTVDQLVLRVAEKEELHRSYQADLVDLETSAVAAICGERLVRFLSIRVISDDAQADLPREVATMLSRSGSYRVGAAIRSVWNRPSSLKDFWALYEHAIEAGGRLAAFIKRCLDDLPA